MSEILLSLEETYGKWLYLSIYRICAELSDEGKTITVNRIYRKLGTSENTGLAPFSGNLKQRIRTNLNQMVTKGILAKKRDWKQGTNVFFNVYTLKMDE